MKTAWIKVEKNMFSDPAIVLPMFILSFICMKVCGLFNGCEFAWFFYILFISVLSLEIQLSEGEGIPLFVQSRHIFVPVQSHGLDLLVVLSFWEIQLISATFFFFYWSTCTKPGKWTIMYMCVRGQRSCICVLGVRGHVYLC